MNKKGLIISLLLGMMICLTGCGNEEVKTTMTQGGGGSSSGYSDFVDSHDSIIDYSDVAIAGGLTDYSYSIRAEAEIDSKEPINDFYNELEKYIRSLNGYMENLSTDYTIYEKPDFKNMTASQKQYATKAIQNTSSGYCNFNIQVNEKHTADVISKINEFCAANNFSITDYSKTGVNYQTYLVVPDFSKTDKDKKQITKTDLERRLAYSSIEVKLSYKVKRTGLDALGVKLSEMSWSLWNEIKETAMVILNLCITAIAFVFCILIPCSKAYKKAMYIYNTKHPEYNIRKRVVLEKENEAD